MRLRVRPLRTLGEVKSHTYGYLVERGSLNTSLEKGVTSANSSGNHENSVSLSGYVDGCWYLLHLKLNLLVSFFSTQRPNYLSEALALAAGQGLACIGRDDSSYFLRYYL